MQPPNSIPTQPIAGQPMMPQPMMPQPMMVQPMPGQPIMPQPVMPQPMMPQPMMAQPVMAQPLPGAVIPPTGGYGQFGRHLDVLNSFGGLYVKQMVELLEIFTGFETANRYSVYLTGPDCVMRDGQQPYFYAYEESDCLTRQCCGSLRNFQMKIVAPDSTLVLDLDRPFKCTCLCFNLPEMIIKDGADNLVGRVQSVFDCFADRFTIFNHENEPIMNIHGDCCQMGKFCSCPCGPCAEVVFDIQNVKTGSNGYIKRVWSGIGKELFTKADNFTLSFPPDADIYQKILLLATVFLIDFMYFEVKNDDNNSNYNYNY